MSKLNDLIKVSGNQYASIAEDGITAGDVVSWIDSGSYAFNALISGSIYKGFPSNKVTGLAANSGTGKTMFALGAVKNFLMQFPDGIVCFFETEGAVSKDMLTARGIDTSRVAVFPVTTVQEFKTSSLRIVEAHMAQKEKERPPIMFLLDSLGMLSTDKEVADSVEGKDTRDMTRAQLIKATFRVLTLKLGHCNIPLVVTNHVYADIGGGPYAKDISSGGTGMVYAASTIINLSKAKYTDGEIQAGVVITATATKSRLTLENTKVKTLIRFDGGLDRYYGLLAIAELAGLIRKEAGRYVLPDGKKVFEKNIIDNPEIFYTKEVLDSLDAWITKNFCYGSSVAPINVSGE